MIFLSNKYIVISNHVSERHVHLTVLMDVKSVDIMTVKECLFFAVSRFKRWTDGCQ